MPSKKKEKKKNTTKCRANCASHKFTFKPKDSNLYHQSVSVNYCPQFCERSQKHENIYPVMNADDKNYYPLFGIDYDKDHYLTHEAKYKEEHERKVDDYVKKKKELLEPKPGRKTQWCAVCKITYEDYLQHVNETTHSNNCNGNQYIQKIIQLSKKFSEQRVQRMQQEDSQHTIKEGNSNTPGDELETQGLQEKQNILQQQSNYKNLKQINQPQPPFPQPQYGPPNAYQNPPYQQQPNFQFNMQRQGNPPYGGNVDDLTQQFFFKNQFINVNQQNPLQQQQQQQQSILKASQPQNNLINSNPQSNQVYSIPNQVIPFYHQPYTHIQQQQNQQHQQQQHHLIQNQNQQQIQQQQILNNKKRQAYQEINDQQEPIYKKQFVDNSKDPNQNEPSYYYKNQIMRIK